MADIHYWEETLSEEVKAISSLVEKAKKQEGSAQTSLIQQADKKLRTANGTKRSYKMECRLVADAGSKRTYEQQLLQHEQTLNQLKQEIMALKANSNKQELFGGAAAADAAYDPQKGGDDLLEDASRIQDKTQASIDNTKRLVAESKETGMNTLEQLHQQRQQIERIDNDVDRIEDNLQRADKLIKAFSKRMATDKLIQSFACINLLLLVGVIVYAVVKKTGLSSSSSSAPSSPVRFLR